LSKALCQTVFDYQVYDIKLIDSILRNDASHQVISLDNGDIEMKVCNDFELGQKINTDSKMLAGECKKAQAFLVGQDKTTCGTSFDLPTVHSLTKEGEPFNNGYIITYTKENNDNSIRIIALCQDDKAPATQGAANLVKDKTLSNAH
jgi:hypothetical protein